MTKSPAGSFQPNPKQQKIVKWMWIVGGSFIVGTILVFLLLSFTNLPTFEELENPIDTYATEIIANDGSVIGRHFRYNRVQVNYDSINPWVVKALVATEDSRFLKHAGIDMRALARVTLKTAILQQKSSGGGSTITQQLAKLLFSDRDFSGQNKIRRTINLVIVKLKEWITAVKLERRYTKQEIIALYLNRCEYVYDAFGIQSAAETYFGKTQNELLPEEAAVLVGMLKNPSYFNPLRRPEKVLQRRNVVLDQMRKAKFITKEERDSLKTTPLDVSNFSRASHATGIARYLMMESRKELEQILSLPEYRKSNGEKYNILTDGLKVYTTIDRKMQKYAEEAMVEHMAIVQDRYYKEWRNMDPWTYGADAGQKKLRANTLVSQMRSSDRYRSFKKNYMEDYYIQVEEDYDVTNLTEAEMELLIAVSKDSDAIQKAKTDKKIDPSRADKIAKILRASYWSEMAKQWETFVQDVEKDFNTKQKLKIFAYKAPDYEKDSLITPLDSIRYHRMIMQSGVLAVDPSTGQIKAWVGGVNYKYFQYDHIRANRQVGSTFKSFIYAAAIANFGISPCFPIIDMPYTINPGDGKFGLLEPWTPKNSEGKYTNEPMDLYTGLAKSVNSISVYLMKTLGDTEPIRAMMHNMGIDSTIRRSDGEYRLPRAPSIALGAADLSVFEMTGAYATFANNGVYKKPYFISYITDKNGKVIYRAKEEETVALPEEANYVMVGLLRKAAGVLKSRGVKSDVGGKTGTTNDHVDGWFMGITPGLVVGTWVGGSDRWIRFRSFSNGQGSMMARPIFEGFIKRLEADDTADFDPNLKFYTPPEPRSIITDCTQYRNPNATGGQNDLDDEFKIEEF
jgi:penicillin-binding protein 1A